MFPLKKVSSLCIAFAIIALLFFVLMPQKAHATLQTVPAFARNLGLGELGEDVRHLQVFLNNAGFTVSHTGPGSQGEETDYFGFSTGWAVRRYQLASGILVTGFFGPTTRASINATLQSSPHSPVPAPLPAAPLPEKLLTRTYAIGERGEHIRQLQVFLNSVGFLVSRVGPGSPGNETDYFGPGTRASLREYGWVHGNPQPTLSPVPVTQQEMPPSSAPPERLPRCTGIPVADASIGLQGQTVLDIDQPQTPCQPPGTPTPAPFARTEPSPPLMLPKWPNRSVTPFASR